MARGINKVILVGNLGADPETRYATSGAPVTTIRIATSESWRDKQSGEQQERTEWHRVKFFGRLAEIAAEYLRKGSQVYVEGSLRTDKYTGQDGVERYTTDIIANEMQMLGGRGEGSRGEGGGARPQRAAPRAQDDDFETRGGAGYGASRGGERPPAPSRAPAPPANDIPFEDDDIPF